MSEAPEPTFLQKLRKAREAAMPGPWATDVAAEGQWLSYHGDVGEEEQGLIVLLVNNAEKIERLVEALQTEVDHYCHWPMEECHDPDCTPERASAEEAEVYRAFNALQRD